MGQSLCTLIVRSLSIKSSILFLTVCAVLISLGCHGMGSFALPPSRIDGIASRYYEDNGIAEDSDVILFEDFEIWQDNNPPSTREWDVYKNASTSTKVVPGKVSNGISISQGKNIIEIACWSVGQGEEVGGIAYKLGNYDHPDEGLGPGYEEIFIRYYMKFDEKYRIVPNHGVNIGGRDVNLKDAAWVGMAGFPDISSAGYFFSGLEPAGLFGDQEIELDIYSYHIDKRGAWGESFRQEVVIPIKVGEWHCIERHLKLNYVAPDSSEVSFDGIEELWIDGKLSTRIEGIRYRKVPHLRITFISLETYYHRLPKEFDVSNPIKVYIDNIVIASKYIGPVSSNSEH
jgi:hypothetical protein